MKNVDVSREIGTKCVIESFADGSAWTVQAHYGQGVLTATYIAGKLKFDVIRLKNGQDSVKSKVIISEFKKFVKAKFKEIDQSWLKMHNELYGLV